MKDDNELLDHLIQQGEKPWLEFKVDNSKPDEIGEYASALANSAALEGMAQGWLVWGVSDNGTVVGTEFDPDTSKGKGNEGLKNWLSRLLTPPCHLRFIVTHSGEHRVVVMEVPCSSQFPTKFSGAEWVRIGEHKKPLATHPELEKQLWESLSAGTFEDGYARRNVSEDEALQLLNYPDYFNLVGEPLPGREGIFKRFLDEGFVIKDRGSFHLTNLGAITCARDLSKLPSVARKAPRLIFYKGLDRVGAADRDYIGQLGYAIAFEKLVTYLQESLPSNEAIESALRKRLEVFPMMAVRELVANALIHQDFDTHGAGPMIEVFSDRMEVTSPGAPLIELDRLLDSPPRSRNERLAAFMRRCGICEERGSGIDKVIEASEAYQLPPPQFQVVSDQTRITLFAPRSFADMTKDERIRACYQHACLLYVAGQKKMSNQTLRERLGIEERNKSQVSRIIKSALEQGAIKPASPESGPRNRIYIPTWAS